MLTLATFGLALLTADPSYAQSRCRFRDMGRPNVIQNQDGAWQVILDPGQSSCQTTFDGGLGRSDYQTTSVSLVSPPRAGTVRTSSNGFSYSGQPGDSFALRICGKSRAGEGCARVTYNISR